MLSFYDKVNEDPKSGTTSLNGSPKARIIYLLI